MGLLLGKFFNTPKFAVLVRTFLMATVAVLMFNPQLVLQAADGRAEAGKGFWQAQMCQYCHGVQAGGAWEPDLAGRGISEAQIKHALRQP